MQNYALYESEQAWLDSIEATRLAREISNVFRHTGYKSFTLDQLREVGEILGLKPEET